MPSTSCTAHADGPHISLELNRPILWQPLRTTASDWISQPCLVEAANREMHISQRPMAHLGAPEKDRARPRLKGERWHLGDERRAQVWFIAVHPPSSSRVPLVLVEIATSPT